MTDDFVIRPYRAEDAAGVRSVRVPHRDREPFRAARKASWGAAWG